MRPRTSLTLVTLLLTVTACGSSDPEDGGADAGTPDDLAVPVERSAELVDPEGSVLGTAWLRDADNGTEVEVDVSGLPAGLQDVGLFESQDCESLTPTAPVIDLPSLPVGEDGTGALTTVVHAGSLEEILAGDGVTVVVRAAGVEAQAGPDSGLPDDYLACADFSG